MCVWPWHNLFLFFSYKTKVSFAANTINRSKPVLTSTIKTIRTILADNDFKRRDEGKDTNINQLKAKQNTC